MKTQIPSFQRSFRTDAFVLQLVHRFFNAGGNFSIVGLSFLFTTLFCVMVHAQNCVPNIEWQISLGGDTTDQAGSVTPTSDGGYVVAGYTSSNNGDVSGNHGQQDYWLVKLAADGSFIWQEPLGGSHEDIAHAIIQTSDDGFAIAGSTRSNDGNVTGNSGIHDFWVAKLDANGGLIWQNALGGTANDFAYAISQTTDGGYIVAGSTTSNDGDVTGNHGLNDYWVVKLDVDGNLEWQKTLGGTHNDEAYSVKQSADGGYIVAGYTASSDGDVTGNQGVTDYWIVKLDGTGNLSWQKNFGGPNNDVANYVQVTSDGGYIVAGSSSSNSGDVTFNHGFSDYWIVKLDSAGTLIWQKALGGGNIDYGNAIEQTSDGGYIAIGNTVSNDGNITGWHGGIDSWVTKQDANGNLEWEKAMGGTSNDGGYSVKQTPDNNYITAGYSTSNDGDVTGNHGFEDFWVVRLSGGVGALNTYYADVDGDGYGDPNNTIDTMTCTPPAGYLTDNTDCNDANPAIHPGATEICNAIDDNCNITIDEGLPITTYYMDVDNDGYGNSSSTLNSCTPPVGFVTDSTDCDDTNPEIHPGATEICNGFDEDCDGTADNGLPAETYYIDVDGDNYGNANVTTTYCSQPGGYVTDSTDCDDTNPNVNPGVLEVSNNGIDDNCNGATDEFGVGVIEVESNSSLMIFPNPATNVIILHLQTNSAVNAIVSITNVLGQSMFEKTSVMMNGTLHEEISLDEKFTEGIYLVRVSSEQKQWSQSLLVLN
ncbi:MAG TPA: MopE-related protein [Chitinophagales bacterium]|nr:MopE-related protein [Chitinophagales bacterium]